MKIAARLMVVITMLATVLAFTVGTSSAASSKDEGYCVMSDEPNGERSLEGEPEEFHAEGKLKHKYNQNSDKFDLKCKGQTDYLPRPPGTYTDGFAYETCYSMGFIGDDYFIPHFYGEVTKAKVKINANGKFTIKCTYDNVRLP